MTRPCRAGFAYTGLRALEWLPNQSQPIAHFSLARGRREHRYREFSLLGGLICLSPLASWSGSGASNAYTALWRAAETTAPPAWRPPFLAASLRFSNLYNPLKSYTACVPWSGPLTSHRLCRLRPDAGRPRKREPSWQSKGRPMPQVALFPRAQKPPKVLSLEC